MRAVIRLEERTRGPARHKDAFHLAHLKLHALPGGRGLLDGVWEFRNESSVTFEVLDLESRQSRPLVDAVAAVYARSGHLVYVKRDGTVWAAPFDLDALEMTSPAVQVLAGVFVGPDQHTSFQLSANGTLLYLAGSALERPARGVAWRDRSGAALPDDPGLPSGPNHYFNSLQLSPDDSKLAVTIEADGKSILYVKDVITYEAFMAKNPNYMADFGPEVGNASTMEFSIDGGVLTLRFLTGNAAGETARFRKADQLR